MPLLSPTVPALQVLCVFDHLLAFGEFHVRFLPIAPVAFVLATAAHLADKICRADARVIHLEKLLHGFLDLLLRRARRKFKHYGVLRLFHAQAFFRDDRPPNDLIVRRRPRLPLPLFLCRLRGFLRRRRFLCCRGLRRRFLLHGLRRRRNRFHVRHYCRLLLWIERVAQPRHRVLRKHQQVMLQHIVRLQNIRRRQGYALDVAAGALQISVFAVRHEQSGLFMIQFVQHGQQRLGLVRSDAQSAQVPPRSFMQQVLIDLRAKDRVRQLHLTDFLAIQIDYVDDRHNLFSFSVQNLLTYFAFLALRIKMYVPLGPGTDPRTSSRFSSVSTFTTFKFFAVTRTFPM